MTREQRKDFFIHKLAQFLAQDQELKSVQLQREKSGTIRGHLFAREWAELRSFSPLLGYPTVQEAEETLKEFLA